MPFAITFEPSGPKPIPYSRVDVLAPRVIPTTTPRHTRSQRKLAPEPCKVKNKRDKAATRASASCRFEYALATRDAHALDAADAAMVARLAFLSTYLTPIEARTVNASLARGTINSDSRRALRLAAGRAANA